MYAHAAHTRWTYARCFARLRICCAPAHALCTPRLAQHYAATAARLRLLRMRSRNSTVICARGSRSAPYAVCISWQRGAAWRRACALCSIALALALPYAYARQPLHVHAPAVRCCVLASAAATLPALSPYHAGCFCFRGNCSRMRRLSYTVAIAQQSKKNDMNDDRR